MTSSRLRILLSFVVGTVIIWVVMSMVAQQIFVFKRDQSTLKPGDQGQDVHSFFRASKFDSKRIRAESKWMGKSVKKSPKKPSNDTLEQGQFGKVRLLCWVVTSPKTLKARATNVAKSWGKRCPQTLYMSSEKSPKFPGNVVGLKVNESRDNLWKKTRMSLEYLYKHHFNDADWFFKADDDTFVIVENLMTFLSRKDASEPVYFGFNFNMTMAYYFGTKSKHIEYMSGGGGYAMSKEALKIFVEEGLSDTTGKCPDHESTWPEDMNFGICMDSIGVRPGDSRDRFGRPRFIPTNLEYFLNNNIKPLAWLNHYAKFNITKGQDCCSDSLISIHYVSPKEMMDYDFLLHNLKVLE